MNEHMTWRKECVCLNSFVIFHDLVGWVGISFWSCQKMLMPVLEMWWQILYLICWQTKAESCRVLGHQKNLLHTHSFFEGHCRWQNRCMDTTKNKGMAFLAEELIISAVVEGWITCKLCSLIFIELCITVFSPMVTFFECSYSDWSAASMGRRPMTKMSREMYTRNWVLHLSVLYLFCFVCAWSFGVLYLVFSPYPMSCDWRSPLPFIKFLPSVALTWQLCEFLTAHNVHDESYELLISGFVLQIKIYSYIHKMISCTLQVFLTVPRKLYIHWNSYVMFVRLMNIFSGPSESLI